jgi:ElaB/YqjD/DUF883 family membrane-anchored ribosome-binding protein
MDAIVRYNRELAEKTAALKAKWGESEKIASAIVRDEKTVVDEVAKVLKDAVDIEAPLHQNAREKFRDWVKTAKDALKLIAAGAAIVKGIPVPPEVLKDPLEKGDEFLDPWRKMAGDLEARKARYADYFSHDHESLLVMFKGTRADAQDFLDKHDYTRLVLDWTSKGRAAIDALRSAAATSGQKADADELASKFSSALEKAEREAKSKWDTFVSENQTKFFGAISPDLEKALVGSDWDTSYAKVGAIDLQGLLQRWIGDLTRDYEQIDWSDMPDSWRDELRARMRASLDRFANTQEEIVRNNSPDAVMAWLKAKQAELAARVRG